MATAMFATTLAGERLSDPIVNMEPIHPPGPEGIGSEAMESRSNENQSHGGPKNGIHRGGTFASSRGHSRARPAARSTDDLDSVGRWNGFPRRSAMLKSSSSPFVS